MSNASSYLRFIMVTYFVERGKLVYSLINVFKIIINEHDMLV